MRFIPSVSEHKFTWQCFYERWISLSFFGSSCLYSSIPSYSNFYDPNHKYFVFAEIKNCDCLTIVTLYWLWNIDDNMCNKMMYQYLKLRLRNMILGFNTSEFMPLERLDGVMHKSSSGLNNSSGTVPSESVRRPDRSQNTRSSSRSIQESRWIECMLIRD